MMRDRWLTVRNTTDDLIRRLEDDPSLLVIMEADLAAHNAFEQD